MAYQVLARKYRPQRFSDVTGQDHVTRTLLNALAQGRTAHGYIFSGHRGIGKTTVARILAMALNCRTPIGAAERPSAEPCGICVSCEEIRVGNSVDMLEIDAATNRGIDEIRELRDAARYSPARDRYKIYLLDEAHQITDAAFNALLKTLEEPPDHVVFMMATTQPEDIPQTIRSRCQHFSFHAVKFDDIVAQLRQISGLEKIDIADDALALLAEAGDGSMRDALSILDQAIASAPLVDGRPRLEAGQVRELMGAVPNPVFEQLLNSVHSGAGAEVLEQINRLLNAGESPLQLARQLVRYLRNCLMAKLGGESTELLQISPDERARAARTAALFSEEDLTRFLQIMLRTFDDLNYRQEQRFHLELGLIKLVHAERLIPLERILSGLPSASNPSGSSGSHSRSSGSLGAGPTSAPGSRENTGIAGATTTPPQAVLSVPLSPASLSVRAGGVPAGGDRAQNENEALSGLPAVDAEAFPVKQETPAASSSANDEAKPSNELETEETRSVPAPDLHLLRDTISAALADAKHATAANLLSAAHWSTGEAGDIRVEVGAKKTMLGLAINAEASKIVREALLGAGFTRKIAIVPAEAAVSPGHEPPPAPPRSFGSADHGIQAIALKNPLVRQAQEIFRAEVRSVLDLREGVPESSREKR